MRGLNYLAVGGLLVAGCGGGGADGLELLTQGNGNTAGAATSTTGGKMPAPLGGAKAEPLADAGLDAGPPSPVTALMKSCDGAQLREGIPTDLGAPGPWPVGALTTDIDGVQVEIWYPAKQGSAEGVEQIVYDTRLHMPPEERSKLPDEHNPVQPCNCFRDLPLDEEAGPYPVALFIHGTAAFRTSNLENAVHWASRGFVVAAADHPGIQLCDMFATFTGATTCSSMGQDQERDARAILTALESPSGDLAFLDDHIDMDRVGVMGHSAGAAAASGLGDVADVVIPYAGAGLAINGDRTASALYLYGSVDGVAGAPSVNAYENASQSPRRHASVARGGHLTGGALCDLRDPTDDTADIVDLAMEYELGGIIGLFLVPALGGLFDGCNERPTDEEPFINGARSIEIVNYLTAGVFEETLQCSQTATAELARAKELFGTDLDEYLESVP